MPQINYLARQLADFAIYSDIRTATTASRGWLTSYEMVRGSPPSVAKMHVFFTRAFVAVPKSKRKAPALAARGYTTPELSQAASLGSIPRCPLHML